jgi:hypothetical protein
MGTRSEEKKTGNVQRTFIQEQRKFGKLGSNTNYWNTGNLSIRVPMVILVTKVIMKVSRSS